ncbi:hypothetical protein EF847_17355 [Actinobacteria bacterium YIM 96077]|nr:hypothetical protein EF847_17355 [Actinobacteria bacterium YIM 96077]
MSACDGCTPLLPVSVAPGLVAPGLVAPGLVEPVSVEPGLVGSTGTSGEPPSG